MMERIEIISTADTFVVEPDSRQTFTVDVSVLDVGLNPIAGALGLLKNANSRTWLHPKDNFNLLSLGITMPFSFSLAGNNLTRCKLFWQDSTLAFGQFNVGDAAGGFWLPMENFELAIGTYVPWPATAIGSIQMYLRLETLIIGLETRVSMVGVPAVFDTLTLPIAAWVKLAINDVFYPAP
jgi:hypothetical protein